jgi:hypothetical protein
MGGVLIHKAAKKHIKKRLGQLGGGKDHKHDKQVHHHHHHHYGPGAQQAFGPYANNFPGQFNQFGGFPQPGFGQPGFGNPGFGNQAFAQAGPFGAQAFAQSSPWGAGGSSLALAANNGNFSMAMSINGNSFDVGNVLGNLVGGSNPGYASCGSNPGFGGYMNQFCCNRFF